jgi:YHS domain-containing protein
MIRLLIFLLLVYLFAVLFRKLFLKPGGARTGIFTGRRFRADTRPVDEMVQDPVCKLYIPKREAVCASVAGTTYFFCSQECLDRFSADKA